MGSDPNFIILFRQSIQTTQPAKLTTRLQISTRVDDEDERPPAHPPASAANALSLQLAFRASPGDVDRCAAELKAAGVELTLLPTDQPWGHRTLFYRDPDGNVLEIYADI